jgi:hypothetical protein
LSIDLFDDKKVVPVGVRHARCGRPMSSADTEAVTPEVLARLSAAIDEMPSGDRPNFFAAQCVLRHLARWARSGECDDSIGQISKGTRVAERTVKRSLVALVEAGLMKNKTRGGGRNQRPTVRHLLLGPSERPELGDELGPSERPEIPSELGPYSGRIDPELGPDSPELGPSGRPTPPFPPSPPTAEVLADAAAELHCRDQEDRGGLQKWKRKDLLEHDRLRLDQLVERAAVCHQAGQTIDLEAFAHAALGSESRMRMSNPDPRLRDCDESCERCEGTGFYEAEPNRLAPCHRARQRLSVA